MSSVCLGRANLFAFAALLVVTLAGPVCGELVGDNSGTILGRTSNTVSSAIHPSFGAAVTLQEAGASSPTRFESPSRFESAPIQAPAFAAPLPVASAPIREWSAAMGDEPDSPGEGEEFAPMPEPSTWCAGLLTLAALLWPLARRTWTRPQIPLEL